MQNSRPQNWLWKTIAMVALPFALLALPVWWREKTSWRPYPLPVKFCARSITFSPDSKLVAVGEFGWVNVWEVQSHALVKTIETGGIVQMLAFSPDGNTLVCGMSSSYLVLWDWRNGRPLTRESVKSKHQFGSSNVETFAFTPDGQFLMVGMENGELQRWNLRTMQARHSLTNGTGKIGVALSPDGSLFARCDNGGISLNDTRTGKLKTMVAGDGGTAIALSKDGSVMAAIGWREKLVVWNTQTGVELRSWPATIDRGTALAAISPDGTKVSDGNHLWDVATGELLKELSGDRDEGLAFSPDGATLATGSSNSAELWRLK